MVRTPEEIEEELKELQKQRKKAERDYSKALEAGFKKHEACCPDVCTIINDAISKLNNNISKATELKERTPSKRIERELSKDITSAESKVNELKSLKEELYAKHVCRCK